MCCAIERVPGAAPTCLPIRVKKPTESGAVVAAAAAAVVAVVAPAPPPPAVVLVRATRFSSSSARSCAILRIQSPFVSCPNRRPNQT